VALPTPETAIKRFKSRLREDNVLDHLYDYLSPSKKKKVGKQQLRDAVIDALADEIDPSTLI
jgi:hypothetical protein